MGCGASRKVVPEPPALAEVKPERQSHRSAAGAGPGPEVAAQAARWMQVAYYRAKFDPRVLARYDIKALIGTGSFSKVLRVEQKITKKPFAIKVMDIGVREGREACESELNVLRRVSHHYIVQLTEIFASQDRVYMVMELATGGELFDRLIAQGSFTERDAVRILQMVTDGIRYLHALRITHRDLKPENLLYYHPGAESKILITDFGLAYSGNKNGDWTMKTFCGTPEYIAPEILLRKPYTSAVDMWALGVITYVLLSGVLPFDDESHARLYRKILKGKYNYTGEVAKASITELWLAHGIESQVDMRACLQFFLIIMQNPSWVARLMCAQELSVKFECLLRHFLL
ncbi:Serine/threonine-protein kinase H2 [Tupaia chinensis]|uniref:Serine/threonine-protein kinase H2 n=1 Tax=Tupaia chinensis TaxID=246437 RepID=L9JD61_TUPCH|nr:Serine/threonine-protein kinase H2 [Tupaia chinensis]